MCRKHGACTLCQLQTLCLERTIFCSKSHGRICGRFTPVRKWVPARPTKFADQLSHRLSSMAKRFHQSLLTVSISFVPLFRNRGRTPPNGVSIHLFGPTERRLKRVPFHHSLVDTVVRVYTTQWIVRERPLAGTEAVALVDEDCRISLTSLFLPVEDSLPSVAVARPLVQDKGPGEVSNIDDSLK